MSNLFVWLYERGECWIDLVYDLNIKLRPTSNIIRFRGCSLLNSIIDRYRLSYCYSSSDLVSHAGAIADCLVGELKLAQYFLTILSTSDEYKRRVKLPSMKKKILPGDQQRNCSAVSETKTGRKKQVPDHTQVCALIYDTWAIWGG